jgi:hypothetical protein
MRLLAEERFPRARKPCSSAQPVRSAARLLLAAALLAAFASCARNVAVGHEDALAAAAGEPGSGGADTGGAGVTNGELAGGAMNGGVVNGGVMNGGGSGDAGTLVGPPSGALLWSADHETASFEQWLSDGDGIQYEQRTGQLEVTTERAHSGTHAVSATITTGDGELHQAVLGRNIRLREGRYGAWFLLPESPRADYWVILKLSNGSLTDRFDLDIEAREGAAAHLRLFEHPNTWITEPAATAFPIGRWVHVEVLYRSSPNPDGRLLVVQDGQLVLDSGARVTANDDLVTFYCGSISRSVAPSPFHLFIDDASIYADVLP